MSRDFMRQVAQKGSDPARYAFKDAQILFSRQDDIARLMTQITR